ncbi:MAG: PAS domain S-box protein [Deltaproteobacteria bacterium]|nr:PAS domain S-box protein [Deltaproteobacteria bacterium]
MLQRQRKSLTLRIAFPVVILILLLGVMLDRFVLNVISDFTKEQIQRDLGSISRIINNICDINFENLLMEGKADDRQALTIEQGLVLGQVEDLLVQEDLLGIVYDKNLKKILLKTDLPLEPVKWMDPGKGIKGLKSLGENAGGWFAFYEEFSPWGWQIIILKNEIEYSSLKTRLNKVYLNTLLILIFASALLIFFIHQTIKKPVNTIIQALRKGKRPNYQGIYVFEFLSDSITGMMDSIKKSEEKYRSIIETATGFVWEVDKKGNYTFISETVKNILGYDPKELLGKSAFFTMPEKEIDRMSPVFRKNALCLKPFENLVNKNLNKQGRTVFLETRGVPIIAEDGRLSGYRGVNKDITLQLIAKKEHKELERHRHQLQKMEAIGTLAAGIAHDFNNLLFIIMGNVSLSKVGIEKGLPVIKYLKQAEAASARAGELANELITLSKGGMPILTVGSIKNLLAETAGSIIKDVNVKLLLQIQENLLTVEYDEIQMKQVFINIITNALESMPNGGLITIDAQNLWKRDHTDKVESSLPEKIYVKITFKDQGRGIERQHLENIFDPYFTTREMGTKRGAGLGLAVVYSIVSHHDGRISVSSEPGCGTMITLYIPACEKSI